MNMKEKRYLIIIVAFLLVALLFAGFIIGSHYGAGSSLGLISGNGGINADSVGENGFKWD
ncbi:MAG TPA: hypothetical protein DCG85_06550 [Lachnospiraceae bacterium]|nr:hypothetical protein [Lachnospiraceae bacterium]